MYLSAEVKIRFPKMKKTQVCIVGAGPAGATASLYLSQKRIAHTVVDRSEFPRPKVCGESFDGKVFHILKDLDESWLNELEAEQLVEKCRSYRLINSHGYSLPIHFKTEQTPRLHIKRADFDFFLHQKMSENKYAEILTATNVQRIRKERNKVILGTSRGDLESELLIVATGGLSLLPQKILPGKAPQRPFLFARAYFTGVRYPSKTPQIDIFFIRKPFKGCILFSPLSRGWTNVEIGMSRREWEKQKVSPAQALMDTVQQDRFSDRMERARLEGKVGATAMNLSTGKRQYSTGNILLAGSAAGSVNPVTGFGVGHAMLMGKLAALTAEEALKKQDCSASFLRRYDKAVQQKLKNELIISNWNTRLLKRIDLMEPMIYLLSRGQLLSDILSDEQLINNLRNPAFYWKKIFG